MKIGIIGNGFVGKATRLLACGQIHIYAYDIVPELCDPLGITMRDIQSCDLVFICVPTPLNHTGDCQTDIIDSILKDLDHPFIIIRSTIPVGYSRKKNCFFMPEFLTELNWRQDFINNENWIVGLLDDGDIDREEKFIQSIYDLFSLAFTEDKIKHNKVIFCKNEEAEMAKLVKNSFLAAKVAFFNEIFDLANALGVDYGHVIELVSLDKRIGSTHCMVPGPPDVRNVVKRGYGGTCLPKDTNSVYSLMNSSDLDSVIIQGTLYRNEYVDRRERDWLRDKGRAMSATDRRNIYLLCGDDSLEVCQSLLSDPNNFVISLYDHDIKEKNYRYKKTKRDQKLFFPFIDGIYFYALDHDPRDFRDAKDQCTQLFHLIELSELHGCEIHYRGNKYIRRLYELYLSSKTV